MVKEILSVVENKEIDIYEFFSELQPSVKRHCGRVANGTALLLQKALESGLCDEEPLSMPIDEILTAVSFHDIGKVLIPERILNKVNKLSSAEYQVYKKHTNYGAKILQRYSNSSRCEKEKKGMWQLAAQVALSHHERWDGEGYPFGLLATAIPLVARATTILDFYDEIVSDDIDHLNLPHEYGLLEIVDNSGTRFDPELVSVFKKNADAFYGVIKSVTVS